MMSSDIYDDECIHGMPDGTCSICKQPKARQSRPNGTRSIAGSSDPEQYRIRYGKRPETFDAYLDVYSRLHGAKNFPGGFAKFTQAANAEPAVDADLVRRAEELMLLGGYEPSEKLPSVGRRWWPAHR
jgi:hypothetical protein